MRLGLLPSRPRRRKLCEKVDSPGSVKDITSKSGDNGTRGAAEIVRKSPKSSTYHGERLYCWLCILSCEKWWFNCLCILVGGKSGMACPLKTSCSAWVLFGRNSVLKFAAAVPCYGRLSELRDRS